MTTQAQKITRRERCAIIARRMHKLTDEQSMCAWIRLGAEIDVLALKDIPKFNDLFEAIRKATIHARAQVKLRPYNIVDLTP